MSGNKLAQVLLETIIAVSLLVVFVAGIAKFVVWSVETMSECNKGVITKMALGSSVPVAFPTKKVSFKSEE